MKRFKALAVAMSLLLATGCSSLSKSEKKAIGTTIGLGAVIGLIVLVIKSDCEDKKCKKGVTAIDVTIESYFVNDQQDSIIHNI